MPRQARADILSLNFAPPSDERLVIEAMTVDELQKRAPPDHFTKLQRANFFRLFGVARGKTKFMVDFSIVSAKPQDWILIRPGQVMRYDFSRPWAGWLLVFRADQLVSRLDHHPSRGEDIAQRINALPCLHSLDKGQHAWMNQSLLQMRQDCTMSTASACRNDLLRLQLMSTLLRLSHWQASQIKADPQPGGALAKFNRFRECLERDFAQHHQVQHYANVLGMSEKSLSRACLEAAGIPAKTYIAQRLVLEGKRLLVHTSKPIVSISLELGFDEATHFTKFFRRITAMTPLEFRKQNADERP